MWASKSSEAANKERDFTHPRPKFALALYGPKQSEREYPDSSWELYQDLKELISLRLKEVQLFENPSCWGIARQAPGFKIHHFYELDLLSYVRMRILKMRRPHEPIIVSTSFESTGLGMGAVCLEPFTYPVRSARPAFIGKLLNTYVCKCYTLADHLVCFDPKIYEQLLECGFKPEKLSYLPACVNKERYALPQAGLGSATNANLQYKRRAADELGMDFGRFTVLCSGSVCEEAGVLECIQLACRLSQIDFVWAGNPEGAGGGRTSAALKQALTDLPENLRFLDALKVSDMPLLYAGVDLYLQLSHEETFSRSIFEAFAAELPVLLPDLPLYRKHLEDYALLTKGLDDVADKIGHLSGDLLALDRLARKSSRGAQVHAADALAEQWRRLYEGLLLP